jgi:hypothetical protein
MTETKAADLAEISVQHELDQELEFKERCNYYCYPQIYERAQ